MKTNNYLPETYKRDYMYISTNTVPTEGWFNNNNLTYWVRY